MNRYIYKLLNLITVNQVSLRNTAKQKQESHQNCLGKGQGASIFILNNKIQEWEILSFSPINTLYPYNKTKSLQKTWQKSVLKPKCELTRYRITNSL